MTQPLPPWAQTPTVPDGHDVSATVEIHLPAQAPTPVEEEQAAIIESLLTLAHGNARLIRGLSARVQALEHRANERTLRAELRDLRRSIMEAQEAADAFGAGALRSRKALASLHRARLIVDRLVGSDADASAGS